MARRKKKSATEAETPAAAEAPPAADEAAPTEEITAEATMPSEPPVVEPAPEVDATTEAAETAEVVADAPAEEDASAAAPDAEPEVEVGDGTPPAATLDEQRLISVVESLLFASDKPLTLTDLKRLLGERDGRKVKDAVDLLGERRQGTGIHLVEGATGWQLRTNPENAPWVGKLLLGKPVRLSRAMLETLAIVAYRQPVTRPEIDEIRGVDCGPVLKTLLDRNLIRIIGKKEEVGRPLLYGTTPDFLRTFNLKDLTELPTLREFHELGAEERAKVEAEHGAPRGTTEPAPAEAAPPANAFTPGPQLAPDPEEDDSLLDELEQAAAAAARASGTAEPPRSQ
jgi:segregation and condensation protein B